MTQGECSDVIVRRGDVTGTYEALVELLMNDFAATPQELNLNQSKLLRNGTDTCRIVNPVVLGTIFRLLEAAPLDLKQSVRLKTTNCRITQK